MRDVWWTHCPCTLAVHPSSLRSKMETSRFASPIARSCPSGLYASAVTWWTKQCVREGV